MDKKHDDLKDLLGDLRQLFDGHERRLRDDKTGPDETLQQLYQRSQNLSRSEASLRHQTAILSATLNNLDHCVVVVDDTSRVLFANQTAEQILGIDTPDVPLEQWISLYGFFLPIHAPTRRSSPNDT